MADTSMAGTTPNRTALFDLVGGQEGVTRMVELFYDIIETRPEGWPVLKLHQRGHGIPHARVEQFNFLCGFFGGPNLFAEKWGHSNVREIHHHVEIDAEARDAWLTCMDMTLDELHYEPALKQRVMAGFTAIAGRLVNKQQAA